MERTKRHRSKNTPVFFLLLTAALLFVTAGALLLRQSAAGNTELPQYGEIEHQDPNAHDLSLGLRHRIFGVRLNDPTEFTYSVSGKVTLDAATGSGKMRITNPPENTRLMAVEITLAGEDTVLYRSGYLKPNQRIDAVTFSKVPEAGKYDAVVYFCAIDPETEELLGILEQPIKLEVK